MALTSVQLAARLAGMIALAIAGVIGAQSLKTETTLTETVLTEEALAKRWRLSVEEWANYKALMEGPRGVWSPTLDPITVLGIDAETEAERKRYAELLVLLEFERVEKELLFQLAYDEAARRLFPSLSPVATADAKTQASPVLGFDRIAFIGSIDSERCPSCSAELERLMQSRFRGNATLDLFLADAPNDDAIRAWASQQGVPVDDVSAGRITLNHARGPWAIAAASSPLMPQLMRRGAGQWSPMSLPR